MKRTLAAALCAGVLVLGGGVAAESASFVVIESAELRAQPVDGAATRGRLQDGTAVQRLARSGGWVRVATDGGTQGWLRMWQVREAEDAGGNPLLRGLQRFSRKIAGLFRARGDGIQENPVTATIGVRGLEAGEFEQAAPAPEALQRVQALRPDPGEVTAFARRAGLQRRQVATVESQPTQNWEDW